MKKFTFLFVIAVAMNFNHVRAQDSWIQRANFGGAARTGAVGFTINDKAYVGTGYASNTNYNDFWEFNPASNAWTQKANFGGAVRTNATGFSIGTKGYIGIGYFNDTIAGNEYYYSDFWEYNPAANAWAQKANFAGAVREAAVGFSLGSKGYICTGANQGPSVICYKDLWEYDPSTDMWTQKADFGGTARRGASAFTIAGKSYVGTGLDATGTYKKDMWEYDPASNTWSPKANFGGSRRWFSAAFSVGNKGYIGTGDDIFDNQNDFWEYDAVANTWTQKAAFAGGARAGAAGFSIGSKGYIGLGSGIDIWEYSSTACNGFTVYADADQDGFGNINNSSFAADCEVPGGYVLDATDCNDNNASIHPGACDGNNGIDDNCDGIVDNGFGTTTYYSDADADGYGNANNSTHACSIPAGYVINNTDCNDANSTIHPQASEIINGIDDNCNGTIDESWSQKAYFPGATRTYAVGFSIGNKGYVGTGRDADIKKDFWEYDPATNVWTQKADFGGQPRRYAAGFSIANKGYIGTGIKDNGFYTNDFWEYNPATNIWTQKTDFGGTGRGKAAGFSIGNKGYIGTGEDIDFNRKKDFWEYDPNTNAWIQKADFGGTERELAVGFSIDNKGYIGTGDLGVAPFNANDFWEYNPGSNTWTQKANFGGSARNDAAGFAIGSKGYIGTGIGSTAKKDFWEYNPATNTWTQRPDFGGTEKYGAVGFSIGNKGYLGTGSGGNDFWEYRQLCTGLTVYADADGDGYGNPSNTLAASDCIAPAGYVYNSTDCNDANAGVHPYATEVCNGIDDNCDGTVDNIIATVIPAGTVTICQGTSVTLTANSGGGIYQWLKSGNNISGATAQSYATKKAGNYSVRETGFNCNTTSTVTTVVVNPSPAATITYTTLDLCGQSSVLLTANSGGGYSYQWEKGLTILTGQTNQTYSATSKGTYKVIVTNSYGCSKTSAGAKVIKSCKESSLDEVENAKMVLYPNPAEDHATIQFTLAQSSYITIKVYDASGKEIAVLLNDDLDEGEHSLPINTLHFPKQVYLVQLISDFGIENQKLIIQ